MSRLMEYQLVVNGKLVTYDLFMDRYSMMEPSKIRQHSQCSIQKSRLAYNWAALSV